MDGDRVANGPAWTYCQETGGVYDPEGVQIGSGFSGHSAGVNNPQWENSPNMGPIPQGLWQMGKPSGLPSHLGPLAIPLEAMAGTASFGRTGFYIHGDTGEDVQFHTMNASHGCVVLGRPLREKLVASPVKLLRVVKSPPPAATERNLP